MKKKLLILSLAAICLAITAIGTVAFFTADDTAHNVITTGEIAIDLFEWADDAKTTPFPENGVNGVMPGTEVTKIVEVKNTGANAAWVRIKVEKAIQLAEDAAILEGFQPDAELVKVNFNETDWTAGEDGYFYCKTALAPGQTTVPLFTTVSFEGQAMGNEYQNSTATVTVTAEAVQTANNAIPEGGSVTDIPGWPAA